ncbi:MAG: hypothetical protein ACLR7Z_22245 [Bilophila wadsworthia]
MTKPAVPRPEFPGTPSRLKHDRGSFGPFPRPSPVNPHTQRTPTMTNLASLREQKELRYARKGWRWP